MRNSFVMWSGLLERITKNPEWENVILGTSALARDLQRKLRLLNLKAPFLVGDRDEPEQGIRHYDRLAELEDVARYRFIVCFDTDEWTLFAPVPSAVYKLLGKAINNHPRLLNLTGAFLNERAGGIRNDAHVHGIFLKDGRPFEVLGENRPDDFKIHILGSCLPSSIFRLSEHAWSEMLAERLRDAKFDATVYAWGHYGLSFGDDLIAFLRDVQYRRPNLVIFYGVKPHETRLYVARRTFSLFLRVTGRMISYARCVGVTEVKRAAGPNIRPTPRRYWKSNMTS